MSSRMNWKEDLVRFHVDFGPDFLFERVYFKMKDVHSLDLSSSHFKKRCVERKIPVEVLNRLVHFDISEWVLKVVSVRKDRGKFYSSSWEYVWNGSRYWATIATGNKVLTIVEKSSSGLDGCIFEGELFDFVEKVNRTLMEEVI